MRRCITLPAVGIKVSLGTYVKAVKTAIAKPELEFKHGLSCWYPCKGKDIRKQFLDGIHDRINQAVPYSRRGVV